MEQPHVVEQAEAVVNPNQTWFPHVLQFTPAARLKITLPKGYDPKNCYIVDVVYDQDLTPEFPVSSSDGWWKGLVKVILESRPARGDWDKPFWRGIKPTWYRCVVELVKPEK